MMAVTHITSGRLAEIADLIGRDATLRLAAIHGGRERIYIPRRPTPAHPLAEILGWEALSRLSAYYGGESIEIPRNANARSIKLDIQQLKAQGLNNREIATRLGCTQRWVRFVLNGPGGGTVAADAKPCQNTGQSLTSDE